ncbi:hypothetical protein ACFFHM_23900 [Halalkalibacter kiskunsagensis]|uniref:Uncharacterized protein n=1 Tax=Halalkalibacter kiskunsagensis TaxID=1548599 RepID=A0ABV6KJF7_9BACI
MPLENLFEFIAQNFIFVAVIVGGIISMLGRLAGGGQQQEQRGRQNQRPNQQPNQQREEKVDWRDIFRQEEIEPEREVKRQSHSPQVESAPATITVEDDQLKRQQEIQDRYDELRQKRENATRKGREIRDEMQSSNKNHEQLDLHLNQLSNKEAMKAVVWSEVLGPPRARQPHKTFIRKR